MKWSFTTLCLSLGILVFQGLTFGGQANAWDIVGKYEYSDKRYNYQATITVTKDYQISLESSIVGGICGFDGKVLDREKKKLAKQLPTSPKSVDVVTWNGQKGEYSDEFVFQFTPNSVILKRGPTKNYSYYCGARISLPDKSEVFKKVR